MSTLGRNDPCRCGSGKKYKKCCLATDENGPAARARAHNAIDSRLTAALGDFAQWSLGKGWLAEPGERFFLDADVSVILQLLVPWSFYHYRWDGGGTLAERFLATPGAALSPMERSYLEAQRAAWLSLWEIVEVTPDVGLAVRDLFTGAERFCHERLGTKTLVRRDIVLGRVVDFEGVSTFSGLFGRHLPPAAAEPVVADVRRKLRKKGVVPVERLRDPKIEELLIETWQFAVEALDQRPLPTLVNTDGESLLLTTDHFGFDAAERAQVVQRLAAIPGVEDRGEDGGAHHFTLIKTGNAKHATWENTILGHLTVGTDTLRAETNSQARADGLRSLVTTAAIPTVTFRLREHSDPIALAGKSKPAAREEAAPEAKAALREMVAEHYEAWIDTALPALDGQTPREAAKTKAGRRKVDLLLREIENLEQRRGPDERFDVATLRARLELPG